MGRSTEGRLLVVAYTERSGGLRIISAREATRKERKLMPKKSSSVEDELRQSTTFGLCPSWRAGRSGRDPAKQDSVGSRRGQVVSGL